MNKTVTRDDSALIDTVTGDDFDAQVLHAGGPIAVEFMSYGCSHCRALEPILQQAALVVHDTVRVVRVNVANDTELANRYQVEGTPTLVMFAHAEEVARAEGPRPIVSGRVSVLTDPFSA